MCSSRSIVNVLEKRSHNSTSLGVLGDVGSWNDNAESSNGSYSPTQTTSSTTNSPGKPSFYGSQKPRTQSGTGAQRPSYGNPRSDHSSEMRDNYDPSSEGDDYYDYYYY